MILNSMLPSMRYKAIITKPIKDFLREKVIINKNIDKEDEKRNNLLKGILKGSVKMCPLSAYYFDEICRLCREKNVKLIVIETYVNQTRFNLEHDYEEYIKHLRIYSEKYKDVIVEFFPERNVFPDSDFQNDGIHLNRNTKSFQKLNEIVINKGSKYLN